MGKILRASLASVIAFLPAACGTDNKAQAPIPDLAQIDLSVGGAPDLAMQLEDLSVADEAVSLPQDMAEGPADQAMSTEADAAVGDMRLPVDMGPTSDMLLIEGVAGCNCAGGEICGTGAAGDPFRCCNLAQDTCGSNPGNNACIPWRCNPTPDCCVLFTCPGNIQCGSATDTCLFFIPASHAAPDDTPCDDKKCSQANPSPAPIACGGSCTKDSECSAGGTCSGVSTTTPGEGGPITSGKCCPPGTACVSGFCICNNGKGGTCDDVCRNGICSADNNSC